MIDTRELVRSAGVLAGEARIDTMPRLVSMLARPDGVLRWQVSGAGQVAADRSDRDRMDLMLSGRVGMQCVRCLGEVEIDLDEHRAYRFVASESVAEEQDLDDDAFDLLVAGAAFDLAGLIEDEAIMALPSAPAHQHCPEPLPLASASDRDPQANAVAPGESRVRPFANLAALTGRGPGSDAED